MMLKPAQVRFGYPMLPIWEEERKMPKEVSEAVDIYTDKFRLLNGLHLRTQYVPLGTSSLEGTRTFSGDTFDSRKNEYCTVVTVVNDSENPIPELKFVNFNASPDVFLERVFNQVVQYLAKKSAAAPPEQTLGTPFPELLRGTGKNFIETQAKEAKTAGLEQLPPFVKCQRWRNSWEITLDEFHEIPMEEIDEQLGSHPNICDMITENGGVEGWHVNTAEGLAELARFLRNYFSAQAEEEPKKTLSLPTSWTMNVNIPKANRHQQQRLNQLVQLLADDMLPGESPDRIQQQLTQKTKLKESGK